MHRFRHFHFFYAALLIFSQIACGLISDQPSKQDSQTTAGPPVQFSKEIGFQCLTEGQIGCAKDNYCGLSNDRSVALHCCLTGFLENYFSDNTKHLGQLLGYSPLSFQEIRKMSREDIVKAKALPFGELFLLPDAEAPSVKDLLKEWGASLINQKAETKDLRDALAKFGADLQGSAQCIDQVLQGFQSEEVEKEVFASDKSLSLSPRDLNFLEFALGALGYGLQGVSAYESGVDQFPALPLSDEFLKDINGKAGPGDARLGDLNSTETGQIVALFPLLQKTFGALKAFSDLKDQPSHVDDYLNWRIDKEDQDQASKILKAAFDSLQKSAWVDIPGETKQVNLANLGQAVFLPNSKNLNAAVDILFRDEKGEVQLNHDYLRNWAKNVVREQPE